MRKSQACQNIVDVAAADGVVISSAAELFHDFLILCRDPADAKACKTENLRHAGRRNALVIEIGNGIHVASVL